MHEETIRIVSRLGKSYLSQQAKASSMHLLVNMTEERGKTRPSLLGAILSLVFAFLVHTAQPLDDNRERCRVCLCVNRTVNCSSRNLTSVPSNDIPTRALSLNLSSNNITSLPSASFAKLSFLKYLYIAYNRLRHLSKNAFVGLESLQVLDLSWNNLTLGDEAYPPGVFRPLATSLLRLYLQGNCPEGEGDCRMRVYLSNLTYPDAALSDLANLQSLHMDGLPHACLGPGFGNLTNLRTLKLIGYYVGFCSILSLKNETLVSLPQSLQHLNMSDCNISTIQPGAFTTLRGLISLDLSFSRNLGFDQLGDAMYGLQGSNLRHLSINAIIAPYTLCVLITPRHTRYLRNTSIEVIFAQYNEIEAFCEGALDNMPETLRHADLFANRLRFGRYFKDLGKLVNLKTLKVDGRFWAAPPPRQYPVTKTLQCQTSYGDGSQVCSDHRSIEHNRFESWRLDKLHAEHVPSYTSAMYPDFVTSEDEFDEDENALENLQAVSWADQQPYPLLTFVLPPNLTTLKSRCNHLYYKLFQMDFGQNNSLKSLDLSNNLITTWIGPITGLNLSMLNLANNFAEDVRATFFQSFTSLTTFIARRNRLHMVIANDRNGTLLGSLVHLQVLDLSLNYLHFLPRNIFQGLVSLKKLILSGNSISGFAVNMDHMQNLRLLDLSDNKLHYLSQTVMTHLDNIANLAAVTKETVHIVMSFNPIACTCQHIDFLTWTEDSKVRFNKSNNYYCLTSGGRDTQPMDNFNSMIDELKRTCADLSGILVGAVSCFFCLMVALTSALVYRFRWKLRYLYYASRINYRRLHTEDDSFLYDAFVSYASEDNDFVHGELVDRLEGRAGLRLNVHNRDWTPGRPIPSNIVAAVQSSRRTLVVLTRHLLESAWCHYEMQMATMEAAYTGRDVLLFLLYEDVPSHELPRQVLYNLQASTYILYPEEHLNDGRLVNDFWQRLARAIKD